MICISVYLSNKIISDRMAEKRGVMWLQSQNPWLIGNFEGSGKRLSAGSSKMGFNIHSFVQHTDNLPWLGFSAKAWK
jgi:hypothetical protein